jgi:hypothetical protein
MRGGNVLKNRGSIFNLIAAGAIGASALTSACAEGVPTDPVVTSEAPAPKPISGTVAHTENAAGVKEGTWTYRGPQDTPTDREKARPNVIGDGSTVQVECHEDGRSIDLRQQSPGLGIPSTDDWLKLQTGAGLPAEWIPDVFVDTPQDQPVPEC